MVFTTLHAMAQVGLDCQYYPECALALNAGVYVRPATTQFGQATKIAFREYLLSYTDRVDLIRKFADGVKSRSVDTSEVLHGNDDPIAGSKDRRKMYNLASYYLVAQDLPNAPTYFCSQTAFGTNWDTATKQPTSWIKAAECDVGAAEGDYYQFATGNDPSQPGKAYYVFARKYKNALVLIKPKLDWSTAIFDDKSLTNHKLPDTYRVLNVDGTLGNPITQITLRNWDSVILIWRGPSPLPPAPLPPAPLPNT